MMAINRMLAWQLCDFQEIETTIAKKPYIFVIFQEGGPDPLSTPLDPHMPKNAEWNYDVIRN